MQSKGDMHDDSTAIVRHLRKKGIHAEVWHTGGGCFSAVVILNTLGEEYALYVGSTDPECFYWELNGSDGELLICGMWETIDTKKVAKRTRRMIRIMGANVIGAK